MDSGLVPVRLVQPIAGELRFDFRPAGWEIFIAFRQRPNRVEMIGQEHHRDKIEGPLAKAFRNRAVKNGASEVGAKNWLSVFGDDGEEIGAA